LSGAWSAHPAWWAALGVGLGMLACAGWVLSRPAPLQ